MRSATIARNDCGVERVLPKGAYVEGSEIGLCLSPFDRDRTTFKKYRLIIEQLALDWPALGVYDLH